MPLALVLQAAGAVALLVGLFLLLPLGWAVLAAGGVVLAGGVGLEVARTPRRKASAP